MSSMHLVAFLGLALALACSTPVRSEEDDWWKHAVFYQIYPRSFKDSNNDGVGDIQGIISKLEHLRDAGITAAWLSPIYASPQVDAGYDISNYTDIHYEYGTLDDFDELIKKANELGIKIVMDFVPNHSSDEHEWFIKSENREEGYEDYYVWADPNSVTGAEPNNWISIFKYSAWEYSKKRGQYYLHQFAIKQPDLNYNSPQLVQEMKNVMTFWMDRGVAGFRVDAVPYLFEDEQIRDEPRSNISNVSKDEWAYLDHIYTCDLPETLDMIYQWRKVVDDYSAFHGGDARILMTEAYTNINTTMLYYGDGEREGAQFTFNFFLITDLNKQSTAADIVTVIEKWMSYMPAKYTANWVLGNHDQNRIASRLGKQNVDGYNMLVSMLPGIAVTYNGEEIGMENGEVSWEEGQDPNACNGKEENFNKLSRDFERTPFHWDDSVNAGFNEGAKTWLPVSSKYHDNNLAAQKVEGVKSHYHVYQKIVALRKKEVLKNGDYKIVSFSENVLGLLRHLEKQKSYLLLFNKGDVADTIDLNSKFDSLEKSLSVIVTSIQSARVAGDVVQATELKLDANEALILMEN